MRVKWSRRAPALFPNKVQTSETVPLRLAASHTNNTVCATCKDGTYSNVTDYYSPCQQHTRSEPPPYTCVTPASATLSVFCFWSFQTYPRGTKISLIQYSAIVCLGYKHVWLFAGARPWGESWTSQERPKETQCVATSNLVGFLFFFLRTWFWNFNYGWKLSRSEWRSGPPLLCSLDSFSCFFFGASSIFWKRSSAQRSF